MVNLWEQYQKVLADGCDHQCFACDLWLAIKDDCCVDSLERWKAWSEKRHTEFGKLLRGDEN